MEDKVTYINAQATVGLVRFETILRCNTGDSQYGVYQRWVKRLLKEKGFYEVDKDGNKK